MATVIDSGSGISTTYYYDFIDRLAKYTEKGTDYSAIEGYKATDYTAQPHPHAESTARIDLL